jgi:hypothetical protein
MATRVSEDDLRALIDESATTSVQSFLDDAELLVDETLDASLFTPGRLNLIEKYLAAHLWAIAREKGGVTLEKAGDATNMYKKYDGEGLSSTRFGQQVLAWDTTGQLNIVLSYAKKAQLRVV